MHIGIFIYWNIGTLRRVLCGRTESGIEEAAGHGFGWWAGWINEGSACGMREAGSGRVCPTGSASGCAAERERARAHGWLWRATYGVGVGVGCMLTIAGFYLRSGQQSTSCN